MARYWGSSWSNGCLCVVQSFRIVQMSTFLSSFASSLRQDTVILPNKRTRWRGGVHFRRFIEYCTELYNAPAFRFALLRSVFFRSGLDLYAGLWPGGSREGPVLSVEGFCFFCATVNALRLFRIEMR